MTLIVYSTKYGCAKECGEKLRQELGEGDLFNVDNSLSPNMEKYDRVIVGGSVYMGMLNKKLKHFCNSHEQELKNKRLGLFIVCSATGEMANKQLKDNFSGTLYEHATVKDCLGGRLDMSKATFWHRLIIKMVSKSDQGDKPRNEELLDERIVNFARALK